MRISDGTRLLVGILAVWRVTHLLQAEDGPWDSIYHLRRLAGEGMWGRLLDCFYCLSLWVALPFALLAGRGWRDWLVLWPALSAGGILLGRLAERQTAVSPAWYHEDDEEDSYELLRR